MSVTETVKQVFFNLLLISIGSALVAVAINGILIPHQFVSGGLVGLSLIIHYIFKPLPVGWLYLLMNIPLFVLGWKFVGRRFFYYSIAGMVIFSAAVAFIKIPLPVQDKILSALFAGIITGIGAGIILKSKGSAGGTDIFSVILLNRFSVRVGNTILFFNVIVLAAASVLFSLDSALYTMIYMYVSTRIVELVLTGLSQRKAVIIISPKWEEISRKILKDIVRGVTFLKGQGAYSGKDENVLYTVVTFRELPRIKEIVRKADPGAFVVVHETLEVMGHRIGNQPHW
ncbi:MAG: YitT family protein [Desulfobacteraceae bacterium]|nr:MAG: YitT family protein [Desulfobacteraceae bacterium]